MKLNGKQITFIIVAALLVIDVIVPDPLPVVDELILTALTVGTGVMALPKKED